MKIYQRFISFLYLKYFFIIFTALITFYVGIDLLVNLKDLPKSANLFLLYVFFNSLTALNYSLPLSLIFALIVSMFILIRSNELVALYSLGISKNKLIMPPFIIALVITLIYICMNFTSFVYADKYKKNILDKNQLGEPSAQLFLKFENKFIYMDFLDPIRKESSGIEILSTKDGKLESIISAKKGIFIDNIWTLYDVEKTEIPADLNRNSKITSLKLSQLNALKGFKPKIIENVYRGNITLTISDAIEAIKVFSSQGINISSIKADLYFMIFFPFFAPFMIMIVYYFLPITYRFFNLALLGFAFMFAVLSIWGINFILARFSLNGVILPEIGIIIPILLLIFASFIIFHKNR